MRLALKMILAATLGMLVVLIGFGYFRARSQIAVLDADMRKDHRLIGTTLAVCVARTWTAVGTDRAVELVRYADSERPHLRIGWVHPDGRQTASSPPAAARARAELMDIEQLVLPGGGPAGSLLLTRVPVRDQNHLLGVIEIAETLETRARAIRANISNTIVATILMVGVAGLITLVFGVWLVGRPLELLMKKARRVGEGDLTLPLELPQRDEIGQLAREMNVMCERLAEANSRTEAETSARIRALEQLRHADRLITVGRLAAGVAHELGTPLNIIGGRTKLLRRGKVSEGLRDDNLAAIAEQAERMAGIIRQLLDFARRREPKAIATDLHVTACATVRLMTPIARRYGVELVVVTDDSVMALGDSTQLEQVLSNLILNAIHACSKGGRVEIACGELPATEERGAAPRAYLRVRDDGSGMTAEVRERIFEPFFTTKDIGQGTGLGLSVAHGIVQEHGGSIDVESEPGKGSVFTVSLPLAVSA